MAETLAGIPSIVYGLFGMLFFVYALNWGYSLLAGAFTLAIMVLPTIMRTTEEALLTVPDSYREGSYGLGSGKLRTIMRIILPSAMPGILAGIILAVGRIVGETAALIYTYGSATGYAALSIRDGHLPFICMYLPTKDFIQIRHGVPQLYFLYLFLQSIHSRHLLQRNLETTRSNRKG